MIWVCLIGGLHDGEVSKVDTDQVEIVMHRRVPPPVAVSNAFGIGPSTTTVQPTRYTRRSVRVGKDEIVYFADTALSDLESLQHVLGP